MSFSGFTDDAINKLKIEQFKSENVKKKKVQKTVKFNDTIVEEKKEKPEVKTNLIEDEQNLNNQINIEETKNNNNNDQKVTVNLDEFDTRQKRMEEQNRKRKELLAKALADRTKQTQEEVQRLNEIENEFKKLDAILSGDVRILRKQIDIASSEYMEAQKKYDRIEKEFLEAKFILFQKLEKKQLLTEHLCAIIEKNEERKADKLNELLDKLNVDLSQQNNDIEKEKPDA